MPPVTRLADICTGHGCFPSRANCGASGDVFVNGRGAHRVGDPYPSHCCFTGDTKFLIGDEFISFKDVYDNTEFYINKHTVCFDLFDLRFKETSIEEIILSTSNELIELEFDNGIVIKCTPDHKFLLDNNEWKEAQYLTENDIIKELL